MSIRDVFGLVVRTIGLVCILLAINELRLILVLSTEEAGRYPGFWYPEGISAAFDFVIGSILLTGCNLIVRLIYGKSNPN